MAAAHQLAELVGAGADELLHPVGQVFVRRLALGVGALEQVPRLGKAPRSREERVPPDERLLPLDNHRPRVGGLDPLDRLERDVAELR